jgi:hypothetical protein
VIPPVRRTLAQRYADYPLSGLPVMGSGGRGHLAGKITQMDDGGAAAVLRSVAVGAG